jgi:hypothetical protein
LKLLGAFLLVVVFVGAGIHAERVATAQQRLAESWNSNAAHYSASGLYGQNLRIALTDESRVECDVMVDSIKRDTKMVAELRRANFRTVECGQVRGELR